MQTGEVQPEMRGGRCSPELRDPTQQLHWASPAEKPPKGAATLMAEGAAQPWGRGCSFFPARQQKGCSTITAVTEQGEQLVLQWS